MNRNLKRFFYYWRLPIFFYMLFFVLLAVGNEPDGTPNTLCSILWVFVDVPGLIFFTVRTIYLLIRSYITYRRTGIRDEEFTFPEVDFFKGIIASAENEIDSLRRLSVPMRIRCILFRLLGILLIAGGIVGAFIFSDSNFALTIFTLIIIAGATLCISANPEKYNEQVSGTRMVPCPEDFTNEQLYQALCTIQTSLGYPRFATIRGFKKPVIVYGSESDDYIYVVYHARFFDFFYVSNISSSALKEFLSSESAQEDMPRDEVVSREFASFLSEITTAVKTALDMH